MFDSEHSNTNQYYQVYNNAIINFLHLSIQNHSPNFLVLFIQIFIKLIIFLGLIYIIDIIFYKGIRPIIFHFFNQFQFDKWKIIFKHKLINSISHLIPIYIAYQLFPYFFYHHPKSLNLLNYFILILLTLIFTQLLLRILNIFNDFFSEKNASYSNIAVRSFIQLTKIIISILNTFFLLSYLFGFEIKDIITILGTLTAVVLLIFRDSILGFVAGIQISSSKMIKVNDWVLLTKYNLEGHVREINLITTKIENLDKTISSVPTYDLISSEVKNYSPMHEKQARQIRRSIYFKITSLMFVDEELFNKLLSINLINQYLNNVKDLINKNQKNQLSILDKINNQTITNIGIFRIYIYQYLMHRDDIIHNDILIIRQLQSTPQGVPLEVLCFTNNTKLENFEKIQSEIFDHLLILAKEFNLEISQTMI